jgi:hypothetical protein
MIDDHEWIKILEKLPERGQRVRTLVIKEMIYMGDPQDDSSAWMDDGHGDRGIIAWEKIVNDR